MQVPQSTGAMRQIVNQADLVLLVVSVIDFEGTFSGRLAMQCGPRLMVVANKADLLPSRTPHSDVLAWLQKRLEEADVEHCGVYLASAKNGIGTANLWGAVKRELGGHGTVALIGARQVGKSTLFRSWSEASSKQNGRRKRSRRRGRKAVPAEVAPGSG